MARVNEPWLTEQQAAVRARWRQMTETIEEEKETMMEKNKFDVDEHGFVELGELERDWFFLQKMRSELQTLQAAIGKCETMFQQRVVAAGATGFKINGVRKVTYKQDATFPVAKYTAENPHVASVYTTTKQVFDLETFKRDRPDEYARWRGRSFKYVQNGSGK